MPQAGRSSRRWSGCVPPRCRWRRGRRGTQDVRSVRAAHESEGARSAKRPGRPQCIARSPVRRRTAGGAGARWVPGGPCLIIALAATTTTTRPVHSHSTLPFHIPHSRCRRATLWFMRLCTLRDGTRDSALIVVAETGRSFARPLGIPSLQRALDEWERCEPLLREVALELDGRNDHGEPIELERLA